MKIESDRTFESNISNAVAFKVSDNASKLFSMLGTYLYSKKEECVLHEISANAVDAHKMNGKEDVPIQITLPTTLDMQIRIRDFGPGLSEQNVYKFLTTYGESNKQESNDFIGGWGIGSKSPAAVTDTWKIISHHAGTTTEYLVFVNAEGIPALTKIRSVPTDETGVEVVIPIQESRLYIWRSAIQSVYAYYKVLPKVVNPYGSLTKAIPEGASGWWWNKQHNRFSGDIVAVTSNRGYVLDKEKIRQEFKNEADIFSLIGFGITIEFNVGDLELNLSREGIQYTKKTFAAISNRLRSIYNELKTNFDSAVSGHADELDYRIRVVEYIKKTFLADAYQFNEIKPLTIFINKKYGINSREHLTYMYCGLNAGREMFDQNNFRMFNGKSFKSMSNGFNCWKSYNVYVESFAGVSVSQTTYDLRLSLSNLDNITFVHNDCKDYMQRVRTIHAEKGGYVLIVSDPSKFPAIIRNRFIKASDFDKAAIVRGARTTGVKITDDYVYIVNSAGGKFERCKKSDITNQKAVYVVTNTFASADAVMKDANISLLKSNGFIIVGVKDEKDIPKTNNVDSCLLDLLGDLESSTEHAKTFNDAFHHEMVLFGLGGVPKQIFSVNGTGNKNWDSFVDKYGKTLRDSGRAYSTTVRTVADRIRTQLKLPEHPSYKLVEEFKNDLTIFAAKFKMIKYIGINTGASAVSDVIDYVSSTK